MKKTVKKCKCCGMPIGGKAKCACDKTMCKYCCECKGKKKPAAKKKVVKKKKK